MSIEIIQNTQTSKTLRCLLFIWRVMNSNMHGKIADIMKKAIVNRGLQLTRQEIQTFHALALLSKNNHTLAFLLRTATLSMDGQHHTHMLRCEHLTLCGKQF